MVVESRAGREAILARRVIDATGDADVAVRAGAPTVTTPAEEMQAASVIFHLAGVDKRAFLAGVAADPQTYADWSSGEWTVQTPAKRTICTRRFCASRSSRRRDGLIAAELLALAGAWGAVHDSGD